ncbi:hypothetical protein ACFVP8_12930 [Viridibacillus arvi]|uniref:hypothetical protein n=1 Tax=Viridibacillus arvi TaxID=263475 RepID=UPI00368E90DC
MKVFKLIIAVCVTLLFLVPTDSTRASDFNNSCGKNGNIAFSELTSNVDIEKYKEKIKDTKDKVTEGLKEKGIKLKNPSVLKDSNTNIISIVYELQSDSTDIDDLSALSFSIVDDEISYQFMIVEKVDGETRHVQLVQNDENLADFVVKNDEYVSGTIKTVNGTLDVTSDKYQELLSKQNISTFGWNSFHNCMDKCFEKFGVPKWIQETIGVAAALSCLSLNPVVCAAGLTPLASLYGAKLIACIINCV